VRHPEQEAALVADPREQRRPQREPPENFLQRVARIGFVARQVQ